MGWGVLRDVRGWDFVDDKVHELDGIALTELASDEGGGGQLECGGA